MRLVVQRVTSASVVVAGKIVGEIGGGLLVLVGVAPGDGNEDIGWLARKLVTLRIFEARAGGQMAQSVADLQGGILLVSQFTLFASMKKGTKPSFSRAAPPDKAEAVYEDFVATVSSELGREVETGIFGAMMEIRSVNDGPVTLILDSRNRE